jgi:alpha-L-fucosidase
LNIESSLKQIGAVVNAGPYQPTWESLTNYRVPAWYQDAKFGIFIHWGVYSVPAYGNEWYPRHMYIPGTREFNYHREVYGPQNRFGYKDFIPMFKAEKFDPDGWAKLFADAGARFVVPVAEHHDGFAMYDCSFSEWNAAKMGPKRDVVGQLAESSRKANMTFGLSSHRAENYWYFGMGRTFDSDVNDPKNRGLYGFAMPGMTESEDRHNRRSCPPTKEHMDDWLARTCELVDKYRPQLVWFDWWIEHEAFEAYRRHFAAYYYNRAAQWNQPVAINYKYEAFAEGSAVLDIERGQLAGIRPLFWQTDTAVAKNSWGYVKGLEYKTPTSVIHDLIDIVAKNGALLLNIGPRADGTIPEADRDILLEIGRWLRTNGAAIYETRPWKTFGEGPTQVMEGSFTDTKRKPFTASDIRFTTRGETLYAIALGWPEDGKLVIRSLGSDSCFVQDRRISKVEMLESSAEVKWKQMSAGLSVALPSAHSVPAHAVALRIT